ncbi:hypothetical protein ABZ260_08695 [Streptosporangium sp. NPDC006013]|uniref:hypothetical protein n=1 Tax=Streptosporangium sp. NPDC006013 TaxID=3155596 RepID=UPI0033BD6E33
MNDSSDVFLGNVELAHVGFVPIATCHWQGMANILAAHGIADAHRLFGLSWGFVWTGGPILFGGGRWARLLAELIGVVVEEISVPGGDESEALETELSRQGTVFVAEVDAFHLTSAYQDREHVVHTVIVVERTPDHAVVVDTMNRPEPVRLSAVDYGLLRATPCEGRIDPFKIYVPRGMATARVPDAATIAEAVLADLRAQAPLDLAALDRFIDAYEDMVGPVNVCRAAAERHQASLLFDRLAEYGVPGATTAATALRELSDSWYMIHMLTAHPDATGERQRRRIGRLLRQARANEVRLTAALTDS